MKMQMQMICCYKPGKLKNHSVTRSGDRLVTTPSDTNHPSVTCPLLTPGDKLLN